VRLQIVRCVAEHRLIVNDGDLRPVQAKHGAGVASMRRGVPPVAVESLLKGVRGLVEGFHLHQGFTHEHVGVDAAAVVFDRLLIQADRRGPIAGGARGRREAQQGAVAALFTLAIGSDGQARLEGRARAVGRTGDDHEQSADGHRQPGPAVPRRDGHAEVLLRNHRAPRMLRHYPFGMVNAGPSDALSEADRVSPGRQLLGSETESAPDPFALPGSSNSRPGCGGESTAISPPAAQSPLYRRCRVLLPARLARRDASVEHASGRLSLTRGAGGLGSAIPKPGRFVVQ
jgi:hypothetical protein